MRRSEDWIRGVEIIGLCIMAAVLYGIAHDQITVRICVEYFTIGHPPVFRTESRTLLGLGWGIIATWWVGFVMGIPLAITARYGRYPKMDWKQLVRPLFWLLLCMALMAISAGRIGWHLAQNNHIQLQGRWAQDVPLGQHRAFLAAAFAHSASYTTGFAGGAIVILQTWWKRRTQIPTTNVPSAVQ